MSIAGFLRSRFGMPRPYRVTGRLTLGGLALEMLVNALVPLSFKVPVDKVLPARDLGSSSIAVGALARARWCRSRRCA